MTMQRPESDGPGRSTMQRLAPDENHGAIESKRETILRHLENAQGEINSLPAGTAHKGKMQADLQSVLARARRIGVDPNNRTSGGGA